MTLAVTSSKSARLCRVLETMTADLNSGIHSLRNTLISNCRSACGLPPKPSTLLTPSPSFDFPPASPVNTPTSECVETIRTPVKAAWTVIIAISNPNSAYELKSPPNDARLLLDRQGYRHGSGQRNITLLTDFPLIYRDSNGVERNFPVISATAENIETAIRKATALGGHGLIVYMGHASRSSGLEPTYFYSSDNQKISGKRMLSWFSPSRHAKDAVTILFDACYGASFLILPYTYGRAGLSTQQVNAKDFFHVGQRQLIFISSSGSDERTNAIESGGKRYGAFLFFAFRSFKSCDTPSAPIFIATLCRILNPTRTSSPAESAAIKAQHPQIAALKPLGHNHMVIL